MATSKETISLISGKMDKNISSEMYELSFSSDSQYFVSLASFRAMYILLMKSALLCANFASLIKAPMAVPLRRTYFDSTNSRFSSFRKQYNLMIRNAKEYDFSYTILSFIHNKQNFMTHKDTKKIITALFVYLFSFFIFNF